jgi:hypothetical protein
LAGYPPCWCEIETKKRSEKPMTSRGACSSYYINVLSAARISLLKPHIYISARSGYTYSPQLTELQGSTSRIIDRVSENMIHGLIINTHNMLCKLAGIEREQRGLRLNFPSELLLLRHINPAARSQLCSLGTHTSNSTFAERALALLLLQSALTSVQTHIAPFELMNLANMHTLECKHSMCRALILLCPEENETICLLLSLTEPKCSPCNYCISLII